MAIDPISGDAQASPHDAYWIGDDARWYRPTWGESARLLGWRWIYCTPLLLLVAGLIFIPWITLRLVLYGWKLLVITIALPTIAFANAARNIIRNRKDPFCIHCGYSLLGLPDGYRCPECGQPYLHSVIDEYRRDPAFFVQRHKALRTLPREDVAFAAGPVRRKKSRDGT